MHGFSILSTRNMLVKMVINFKAGHNLAVDHGFGHSIFVRKYIQPKDLAQNNINNHAIREFTKIGSG